MESSSLRWRRAATVSVCSVLAVALSGCIVVQPSTIDGAGETPDPTPPSTTPPYNPPTAPPTASEPTTSSADWADIVAQTQSGVALIDTTGCSTVGVGTGFLIADDLVVTAAHVIEGQTQIHLTLGDQLVPALVLGSNSSADIALLKTLRAVEGHQFEFSNSEPRIGTPIAALGYPMASNIDEEQRASTGFKLNNGIISGLQQVVRFESGDVSGAMQTNADINPGNSGGPLIDLQGDVVGMAFATSTVAVGTAYGIPSERVQTAVEQWKSASNMQPLATCDAGEAPEGFVLTPVIDSQHDHAIYVAQSLTNHGSAINIGNYDEAFSYFTSPMKQRMGGTQEWSRRLSSSYWAHLNVYDIKGSGDNLEVNVEFWTIQRPEDAPEGTDQWCSVWDNQYQMRWNGVAWAIDAVSKNQDPAACDGYMLIDQIGEEQSGHILDMIYWLNEDSED